MPSPDLILGEECRESMLRGFDKIGRLLALTLGPIGGNIGNERDGSRETELLNDAATIARRVLEIPDRSENVGVMMMRHIVWNMREDVGDGSATTAVIAQAAAHEMQRMIAAGANAMMLRRGMDKATAVAVKELDKLAVPLEGEERIAAVASAAIGDPEIGKLLGEIYDVLGPHASIHCEPYVSTHHDRAYQEGARFRGGYASPYFITDQDRRIAVMEDVHVVVAEMTFDDVSAVQTVLEQALADGAKGVFVLCRSMAEKPIGVMVANNEGDVIKSMACTLKPVGDERRGTFENIALLTGATFVEDQVSGMAARDIKLEHMGRADKIIMNRNNFTIVGGAGDRKAIRERVRKLRKRLRQTKDGDERETLRTLLSHFSGGVAELRIGALTSQERKQLTALAEQSMKAVDAAMDEGIVPGGGSAYLACIPAVEAIEAKGDVAIGVKIVARALQEPMRRIAENGGAHPPIVVHQSQQAGYGYGYDVERECIVNMIDEGIADAVVVAKRALTQGISGAIMLLTTDALVLHAKPKESFQP